MKKSFALFLTTMMTCGILMAQNYDYKIDEMSELAVLTDDDWENKEEVLSLTDYFVREWSVTDSYIGGEEALEEVLTYRELPTHTTDDFDVIPFLYDITGTGFEVDEEWEGKDLLEIADVRLEVADLEYKAIRRIISPPCGNAGIAIHHTDVDIPYETAICDFPIKNYDPYLLELRSDRSVHLMKQSRFGVEVGDLQKTGAYSVFKGHQYENVVVNLDAFELQPITLKVYNKWGEIVEEYEGNTGESIELKCSTYWWGMHWIGIYLHEDASLLLKQLYLDE